MRGKRVRIARKKPAKAITVKKVEAIARATVFKIAETKETESYLSTRVPLYNNGGLTTGSSSLVAYNLTDIPQGTANYQRTGVDINLKSIDGAVSIGAAAGLASYVRVLVIHMAKGMFTAGRTTWDDLFDRSPGGSKNSAMARLVVKDDANTVIKKVYLDKCFKAAPSPGASGATDHVFKYNINLHGKRWTYDTLSVNNFGTDGDIVLLVTCFKSDVTDLTSSACTFQERHRVKYCDI